MQRWGVGVKTNTITPSHMHASHHEGLKRMYPSPNSTLRAILGGTIVKEPFVCSNIPRLVPGLGIRTVWGSRNIFYANSLYKNFLGPR